VRRPAAQRTPQTLAWHWSAARVGRRARRPRRARKGGSPCGLAGLL